MIAPGQARNLISDLRESNGSSVVRGFIEINSCTVLNDGLTAQIISPNGVGAAELSLGPDLLKPDSHFDTNLFGKIARAGNLRKATSLLNVSQYNYFHFVSQSLPTLALMVDQVSDSVPVIFGGWHDGGNEFGRDLIKLLFPEIHAMFLNVGQVTRVDELRGVPPLTTNVFEPHGLHLVRSRGRSFQSPKGGKKESAAVYLARGDNERNRRNIANERDVVAHLQRKWPNLRIITPGRMNVIDQMRSVTNAEVIIGLHGAQLTNMIWAPRGATVVEIVPRDLGSTSVFATLSKALQLNYRQSVSIGNHGAHWSVADQIVTLSTLDAAVQDI